MTTATYTSITDEALPARISSAKVKIVLAAPGLGENAGKALLERVRNGVAATVLIDATPEVYHIGYGDESALLLLRDAMLNAESNLTVRQAPGLRIGLLLVDDDIVVWAPTPRAVEAERESAEQNGIVLTTSEARETAMHPEHAARAAASVPHSEALAPDVLTGVLDVLKKNPVVPVDLSRKTRVFSTKFQFIELTRFGAEWTQRRMTLASILLNADLPRAVRDILDTTIKPFKSRGEQKFEVPLVVNGECAFNDKGSPLLVSRTEAEMRAEWDILQKSTILDVRPFGKLIRRSQLAQFQNAVVSYEKSLRAWTSAFMAQSDKDEHEQIELIVSAVQQRMNRVEEGSRVELAALQQMVAVGLRRMRRTEPRIRIVIKDVTWSSTRDKEFLAAIQRVVPAAELEGWFSEFTAAPETGQSASR